MRYLSCMKRLMPGIVLAAAAALLIVFFRTSRFAHETAPFTVVRSDGNFELRDYPELSLVETPVTGRDGADASFMRLFRFIDGANAGDRRIPMTTPVLMGGGPAGATMAFVMPSGTGDKIPAPAEASVGISAFPPGRYAVLRFKGGRNARNETEARGRL